VPFEFAGHVLDVDRRELTWDGMPVALEPQVFDLLVYLVSNRDRVITKDELLASVWHGRIVSESTMAARLNAVRKAIGDTGDQQHLVRTYARKGIRFVGNVRETPGTALQCVVSAAATPVHGKPCLAVLPFANMSGDSGEEYFADGITEDLITELSRNRGLDVVARNSSFAFRGTAADVRHIGRELRADYIVEGSVRRAGSTLRVTAQLSETEHGRQLWAERYDRGVADIFEVQANIAATVAARLDPEVGIAEQRKSGDVLEAWDYFRLGTKSFHTTSADANREAQRLFRRAVEIDPELAQAYAFLSYAIVLSMVYFDVDPSDSRLAEAVELGRKAVELDDRDALCRFMYGRALIAARRYSEALDELETARDINPNLAVVHCGLGDSLTYEGRIAEAIPSFETAIGLSPHDPMRWAFLSYRALAHILAGEFDEAAKWAYKATRLPNCHYWPFSHRVVALAHEGKANELKAAVDELLQRKPDFSQAVAERRLFYIKDRKQLALYIDGLRKAGLPRIAESRTKNQP
jgi:TolB-like protein/Tfp pilus assembly protein PilF